MFRLAAGRSIGKTSPSVTVASDLSENPSDRARNARPGRRCTSSGSIGTPIWRSVDRLRSMDDDDAHRAAAPGDSRRHLAAETVEHDIGARHRRAASRAHADVRENPAASGGRSGSRRHGDRICSPRLACTSANTAALAQACGEQATGYMSARCGAARSRRTVRQPPRIPMRGGSNKPVRRAAPASFSP